MDLLDEKIISILKYGKKRQREIVALLESERSARTIRRHLNDLEETGKIARDQNNGLYYLPNQEREPIQPKPYADPDKVDKILFDIEEQRGQLSSSIDNYIDDDSVVQTILNKLDLRNENGGRNGIVDESNLIDLMIEFNNLSLSKYYVLPQRKTLNSFLRVFDSALDTLEQHNPDRDILRIPDRYFELLFLSTENLYKNWFKGKENERFDIEMTDRADRILSIYERSNTDFDFHLETLLTNISREDSQRLFISMVKSGKYNQERMRQDAFYVYDAYNEIHLLLDDLSDARKEVEDEEIVQDIEQLRDEVLRLYTREVQEVT